ncbi:MAG: pilus assembly protein PilM [Bacteroidales bacterium]|nr:pilus assembly protein PilM [Bacteroidales bacterium]
MEQREYVAALDLGTSKMLAMAASKDSEGVLKILATEKVASGTSIRRGFIYNIEDAATKVSSLVNKLGYKLRPGLKKIYVGLGGQSLRSESYTVKKEMQGRSVDSKTIDALYEECQKYQPELAEILDVVSPEYFLDGRPEPNPIGVPCQVIEAKFQLILGRPSLKLCLKKSIEDKSRVEIAGFFISPLATAEAVLTSREKELGCGLVEFGAGITYVSIYKGGLLKYMIAIPLGGNVITKDLCSTNLLEADAEELKINKGSALSESEKEELTDVIIEARMNEIIANVIEQIRLSGYGTALAEGLVITGGASQLRNLSKSLQQKTNLQVRLATVEKSLVDVNSSENRFIENPANTTIFGLLTLGNENCAKEIPKVESRPVNREPQTANSFEDLFEVKQPETEEKEKEKEKRKAPEKKKTNFLDRFKNKMEGMSKNLFDDNTDE